MTLDRMFDSFSTTWFTGACSLAGFIAAFAEGGRQGFQRFCTRVFRLGFPVWLWAAALFIPVAAALLTFANHPADLMHGGAPKWAAILGAASFANLFTGPLAEEFGWRGYLLNWLCRRWHPIVAGLAIGPIWAAWHIPIFAESVFAHVPSALGFLLWVTAWSVALSLIVARAKGSVLPSVVGHWAINAQPAIFFALFPALAGDRQPGGLAFSVTSVVVAAVIAWLWRRTRWNPAA